MTTYFLTLKGTVQRDFVPQLFFPNSNQLGSLTNGLKYFRFWFRFCQDIRILVSKKLTSRGMIPWGVKKNLILEQWCKNKNVAL